MQAGRKVCSAAAVTMKDRSNMGTTTAGKMLNNRSGSFITVPKKTWYLV